MSESISRGVSVVTPVKGRVNLLRDLLASLSAARDSCPEPSEVLVVDDSGPVDAEAHRSNCAKFDATYLRGPEIVGVKRNIGVQHAKFDLVVFVDSDCTVDTNYLARVVRRFRSETDSVDALAGAVEMSGDESRVLRLFRKTREMHQPFSWAQDYQQITWAACANFAMRRRVFDEVGGFADKPLTVVGGEDVDIGIRVTQAGYPIVCDPKAIVYHTRTTGDSIPDITRRLFTYGRGAIWLCERFPRRQMFRLNPTSAILVASVVGALGARPTKGRSLLLAPAVAAGLLAVHSRERHEPGDGLIDIVGSVVCTVLDWAFSLGETVGCWHMRTPQHLFTRFVYIDDETFVPREREA